VNHPYLYELQEAAHFFLQFLHRLPFLFAGAATDIILRKKKLFLDRGK
jgi:hypothetical protein